MFEGAKEGVMERRKGETQPEGKTGEMQAVPTASGQGTELGICTSTAQGLTARQNETGGRWKGWLLFQHNCESHRS